jgi:hypothetical protein
MQMEDTEILAFHGNLPPIKARRMDWREFPALRQRRGETATPLAVLPDVPTGMRAEAQREPVRGYINPDFV